MKTSLFAVLILCVAVVGFPQQGADNGRRDFGNTRGPWKGESSAGSAAVGPIRSTSMNPGPPDAKPLPPSLPPPAHVTDHGFAVPTFLPIIVLEPVVILTGEGVSPLPPPKLSGEAPEVMRAVLRDCMRWPESSAYDFSDESVVGSGDACADMFYESVSGGPIMEVAPDADIDCLDDSTIVFRAPVSPDSTWSPSHSVSLIRGSTYIVWTWDNQYFTFKVDDLTPDRVAFEWVCLKEMSSKPKSCSVREVGTHKDVKEEAFFR